MVKETFMTTFFLGSLHWMTDDSGGSGKGVCKTGI
jgi:hypothetical protein